MTKRSHTPASGSPTLRRSSSPRLAAYVVVALVGLIAAVATGRAELAIAVVPVAIVALAGVVLAERPSLSAALSLSVDRVFEGSAVEGEVALHVEPTHTRLLVLVPLTGPLTIDTPDGGRLAWSSDAGGRVRHLPAELTAERWGIARLGPVWIRAYGPLGLVRWEGAFGSTTALRILPTPERLRSLLTHPDPRAASGAHLTRRPGDGIEFADTRRYRPGDRLRSVNWSLSSRRHELWVNERRPERSADLVVLVDTFADDTSDVALALERSVRAAWLLAQAHLAVHDRVGLVTFGGYPAWVTPGTGERARYELLDKLLGTTAAWTEAQRTVQVLPSPVVPPGAWLVAVTPLHDSRMLNALGELRRRGLGVAVVWVDVSDLLAVPVSSAAAAAHGLWTLELRRRAGLLDDAGVPVVPWTAGSDAAAVLDHLRRVARAPALRRRAG